MRCLSQNCLPAESSAEMRIKMKIRTECISFFCILIFLIGNPEVAYASLLGRESVTDTDRTQEIFCGMDPSQIHIIYEMNGGKNDKENVNSFYAKDLPFTFKVPSREGYNFSGWYMDSDYQNKLTTLTRKNAKNMILYVKWTPKINNHYNVEQYAYKTGYLLYTNSKTLKDCNYNFWNELSIPGMPSTREEDYLNNMICSASQCPQGICFTTDYVLITSYSGEKNTYGSLLIFNKDTGDYLVTLQMKKNSHLGGITFDGENVWICHSNSNTLERIPYEFIKKIAADAPQTVVDASEITNEYRINNVPSCVTYYGDRLWIATHTKFFDSKMISYSYDKKTDSLTALSKYKIPSKVQGVTFDTDGTVYLSTSYGRKKSSFIKVYDSVLTLSKRPNHPKAKVEMPPCSEEIVLQDDNLYVLFESAGERYFEGTDGNGMSSAPLDQLLEVAVSSLYN